MDKSKLRPATPADLVEGNKIIVEDAAGAFVEGEVVLTLDARSYGEVEVVARHEYASGGKTFTLENETHPFGEIDFEDGQHGHWGMKLWVKN